MRLLRQQSHSSLTTPHSVWAVGVFLLLLLLGSCAVDLSGTASGTENTITIATTSWDGQATPVARVRFHDASALPYEISNRQYASVIEATKSGEGFVAALPAGRIWNAELIGQDSSYRLWVDSCASVDGSVKLQAGPLLKSSTLQGKLKGDLGDEAWIGLVGSDRFVPVAKDGSYKLEQIVSADLNLVVALKNNSIWNLQAIHGWSRSTGEVELPQTLELPKQGGAFDAWNCIASSEFRETSSPLAAPASDLFYSILREGDRQSVVALDLCHGTWSRTAELSAAQQLHLFANTSGRWAFAAESDTLWDLSTPTEPVAIAANSRSQIGLLSATADEQGWATYIYRPAGNRISTYSSLDSLIEDSALLSFTLEGNNDRSLLLAAGNQLWTIDSTRTVTSYNRYNGDLVSTPWKLSDNFSELLGGWRAPSGRVVLLSKSGQMSVLSIVEERTGETLQKIEALPAELFSLSK